MSSKEDLSPQELDRNISQWAKRLKRHQPPTRLWQKIESRLQTEMHPLSAPVKKATIGQRSTAVLSRYLRTVDARWNWARIATAVCTILLIAALSTVFLHHRSKHRLPNDTNELLAAIDTDLGKAERQYRAAIERLTQLALQSKTNIDPPLLALYEEKITLLDESIRQCQKALKINYHNPWAQAALLQAYRQKVETLKLIVLNRKEVS